MRRGIWQTTCAAMVLLTLAGVARAGEFDLSIGYSHLSLQGSESFAKRDGMRIEPRVSFQPIGKTPQFRLGFGLGISGYYNELSSNTIITIDDGNTIEVIEADQWESVSLLEPDVQLSWRQPLGKEGKWYVEPGVALGSVIANYWAGDYWYWSYDDEVNEWDATWSVRPFLRAGFESKGWVFGLETSYLWGGDIDLTDQVQGDVGEFYAGGFFGVSW